MSTVVQATSTIATQVDRKCVVQVNDPVSYLYSATGKCSQHRCSKIVIISGNREDNVTLIVVSESIYERVNSTKLWADLTDELVCVDN